jgi:hypothetical protein
MVSPDHTKREDIPMAVAGVEDTPNMEFSASRESEEEGTEEEVESAMKGLGLRAAEEALPAADS